MKTNYSIAEILECEMRLWAKNKFIKTTKAEGCERVANAINTFNKNVKKAAFENVDCDRCQEEAAIVMPQPFKAYNQKPLITSYACAGFGIEIKD
jgi:hypothetical protein